MLGVIAAQILNRLTLRSCQLVKEASLPRERHHCVDIKGRDGVVRRPSPRRREEDGVGLQRACQIKEVAENEIYLVGNTIHLGVVLSKGKAGGVVVDGDNFKLAQSRRVPTLFAGLGELDGIAADTAEGIDDNITGHSLCYLTCYKLRSNREPAL